MTHARIYHENVVIPHHITVIQIITTQLHGDIPITEVWPAFILTAVAAGDDNSPLCYIMRFCPYKVSHISEDKRQDESSTLV